LPIHGSNRHLFREPGEKHAYSALVGALRRVPEDAPDDDVADVVHVDARLGHRRLRAERVRESERERECVCVRESE